MVEHKINKKIEELQEENMMVKRKVKDLEEEKRKNNLVSFGIEEQEREQSWETYEVILTVCWEGMGLDISKGQVKEVYREGHGANWPILVKLANSMVKDMIMRTYSKDTNNMQELRSSITPVVQLPRMWEETEYRLRQAREIAFKVYNYFKNIKEQNSAGHHGAGRNVANAQETTAEACGVSLRTLQRIVSEGKKSFNVSGTPTFRSPGKHPRREKNSL
ncbi:hypothetical protein ANN_14424 [Periplaneta americana]|uniref:Uncharacterized protein n=1 Tax=Periplaneta americana TaxID=6978 RepID=A0ABQ8SW91_PERAM|nr:hypothetical protein ANN_14424 [Periplaneta americana]